MPMDSHSNRVVLCSHERRLWMSNFYWVFNESWRRDLFSIINWKTQKNEIADPNGRVVSPSYRQPLIQAGRKLMTQKLRDPTSMKPLKDIPSLFSWQGLRLLTTILQVPQVYLVNCNLRKSRMTNNLHTILKWIGRTYRLCRWFKRRKIINIKWRRAWKFVLTPLGSTNQLERKLYDDTMQRSVDYGQTAYVTSSTYYQHSNTRLNFEGENEKNSRSQISPVPERRASLVCKNQIRRQRR